jgi:hypothetical protein
MIHEIIVGHGNKINMEYLHTKESNVAVRIGIVAGTFTGGTIFFFNKYGVTSMLRSAEGMYETFRGKATVLDYETDSFIDFHLLSRDQMVIVGQMGATKSEHCMKFAFETDQVMVKHLVDFFVMLQSMFDAENKV